MAEDLEREIETPSTVVSDLMTNWSDSQCREFNEDWTDDSFLIFDEALPEQVEPPVSQPVASQVGEGAKRSREDALRQPRSDRNQKSILR